LAVSTTQDRPDEDADRRGGELSTPADNAEQLSATGGAGVRCQHCKL